MEPHVELVVDDTVVLNVQIDEMEHHVVDPHIELDKGTEHNTDGSVYPLDILAVEYYEGTEDGNSTNTVYAESELNEGYGTVNEISNDSEQTSTDITSHDNLQDADEVTMNTSNSEALDSIILIGDDDDDDPKYNEMRRTDLEDFFSSSDADEITMNTSKSEALDSIMMIEDDDDDDDPKYNEIKTTYLEDFVSSSASTSDDESSNPSFERIPLSCIPTIVQLVKKAEYETIQSLYQLLYQRNAWDTQEILSKHILEFSGFNFIKSSEEYYDREEMLQTLPNAMLLKIEAILCLDHVKNVLSNIDLRRHDLITAIMHFLAFPREKARTRIITRIKPDVVRCGCRSNCLSKFTLKERELLEKYHLSIKPKAKQNAYFLSLIQINRSLKQHEEDYMKHRDYTYNYKIKLGNYKEVQVCKRGFMLLHGVKMNRLKKLQELLKKRNFSIASLANVVYPWVEDNASCTYLC